mmetsp:Transcript_132612/g.383366  ORF Transcript_132612/g.383366 Transcript_132612/m.383366 type:complete len:233 (-) Transcript_132612:1931-2629(-)
MAWTRMAACFFRANSFLVRFRNSTPLASACIRCADRKRNLARSNSARAIFRRMRPTFVRAIHPRMYCCIFAAAISRRQTSSYFASYLTLPKYPLHMRCICSAAHNSSSMRMASRHIRNLTRKPRAIRCMVITCLSWAMNSLSNSWYFRRVLRPSHILRTKVAALFMRSNFSIRMRSTCLIAASLLAMACNLEAALYSCTSRKYTARFSKKRLLPLRPRNTRWMSMAALRRTC